MDVLALQLPHHSRAILALVVAMHIVAGLLILQMVEARRYIEPVPLMVSLLTAPQAPAMPAKSVQPAREVKPAPAPESVVAQQSAVQPVPAAAALPVPAPVRLDPKPIDHAVARESIAAPMLAPVQEVTEQTVQDVAAVIPLPAPRPPLPEVTRMPEPPATPAPVIPSPVARMLPEARLASAPVPQEAVAMPEPAPVSAAAQPAPAEPQEVTVTAQMLTAIYLSNPKPFYPSLSRRLNEQGTVLLRVFVTISGDASRVELKKSSGFQRLDHAAMDAVQRWKFVPARSGEQMVAAWVVVPIKFSLKG